MIYTSMVWYIPSPLSNVLTYLHAALGIAEEVDRLGLKGNKKKRGKKIDDPDFAVSTALHFIPLTVSHPITFSPLSSLSSRRRYPKSSKL
jgi:hypothetical protein